MGTILMVNSYDGAKVLPSDARTQVSRIPLVIDPTPEQHELLEKSRLPDGTVSNVFRILLHNPKLTKRFNLYAGYFMRGSVLTDRIRELIILRIAWRTHCLYEFAHHRRYAVDHDLLSPSHIRSLVEPDLLEWSVEDRCVLAAVDQLVQHNVVDEETWDAVSSHYTDVQATEVILLAGLYGSLAGLINTLQIPLEDEFSLAEQAWK